jgi:molecular chaperone GrpE (heat shock protein)
MADKNLAKIAQIETNSFTQPYLSYIIIVLLSIFCLTLLILLISIFRKIRSASGDKINLIEFPIETNNKINSFINEVKIYLNELGKLVSGEHKHAVKEINERLKIFEKFANEKNQELQIYKEGYEFSKYKNIINGIVDCLELIDTTIEKSSTQQNEIKNYLNALKEKLEILLSNNGVEKFIPNINQKIFDVQGCEPSQITEKTKDENKINIIHSVLKPGYKIKIKNNLEKIIKKSQVKVYGLANE